mgnify:CR=1 FL=1
MPITMELPWLSYLGVLNEVIFASPAETNTKVFYSLEGGHNKLKMVNKQNLPRGERRGCSFNNRVLKSKEKYGKQGGEYSLCDVL